MQTLGPMRIPVLGVMMIFAGCASKSSAPSEPTPAAAAAPARGRAMGSQGAGMEGAVRCPMQVKGTSVTVADIEGGVVLDFTTTTGDVTNLRERIWQMAETHNERQASGAPPPGHGHHGMMMGGMMGRTMPPATASVEDIAGGARLILRPQDPAALEALRDSARLRADAMASEACPMISGAQG